MACFDGAAKTCDDSRALILHAATDELRGVLPCFTSERRARGVFLRLSVRVAGLRGTKAEMCTRLAVPGFSPRRRAARSYQDIDGDLSWMPVFCATPARPSGLRRASRADLNIAGWAF
jgi:hypothetical protein